MEKLDKVLENPDMKFRYCANLFTPTVLGIIGGGTLSPAFLGFPKNNSPNASEYNEIKREINFNLNIIDQQKTVEHSSGVSYRSNEFVNPELISKVNDLESDLMTLVNSDPFLQEYEAAMPSNSEIYTVALLGAIAGGLAFNRFSKYQMIKELKKQEI